MCTLHESSPRFLPLIDRVNHVFGSEASSLSKIGVEPPEITTLMGARAQEAEDHLFKPLSEASTSLFLLQNVSRKRKTYDR